MCKKTKPIEVNVKAYSDPVKMLKLIAAMPNPPSTTRIKYGWDGSRGVLVGTITIFTFRNMTIHQWEGPIKSHDILELMCNAYGFGICMSGFNLSPPCPL